MQIASKVFRPRRTCSSVATRLAGAGLIRATSRELVSAAETRTVLALMPTCGLQDEVGHFAVRVGVPAKSAVSVAILAVVPGRMAIAGCGPALGASGNSLAGIAMLEHLDGALTLTCSGNDR